MTRPIILGMVGYEICLKIISGMQLRKIRSVWHCLEICNVFER